MIPVIRPKAPTTSAQDTLRQSCEASARSVVQRIEGRRVMGKLSTWKEVQESIKDCTIPAMFLTTTFHTGRTDFYKWYIANAYERFTAQQEAERAAAKVEVVKTNQKFDKIELRPQQRKALDQLIANFLAGKQASWLPLGVGRGKTPVIGAFAEWLVINGHAKPDNFLHPQIFYFTRKAVVLATRDKLQKFFNLRVGTDVEPVMRPDVLLLNYQALSAKRWSWAFEEREIEVFGNKTNVPYWKSREKIIFVALDEAHDLKKMKSRKTKKILGIVRAARERGYRVFFIFASATPASCLDDTRLYNWASGRCNDDNETAYLKQFCIDYGPHERCAANLERYNRALGSEVVRPPNDPLPYKIFNNVKVIDFPDEASEKFYREAEENYIESVIASGGTVGDLTMAQFQIFRHASELCKCPFFAEHAHEHVQRGESVIISVDFKDSLIKCVSLLAELGYTRSQISILWGGEKIIQPEEVYTSVEMVQLMSRMQREQDKYREEFGSAPDSIYYPLSKKEITKFKKTRLFNKQRLWQRETKEEQAVRVGWLRDMNLDKQNDEQRHAEVQRFLRDESVICIMTSAGSVGIDLDNQIRGGRRRRTTCSPAYAADDWIQRLGRDNRLMTQSDVNHDIVIFDRSIESEHVLPKLTARLNSMAAMTGGNADLEDKLIKSILKTGKGGSFASVKDKFLSGAADDLADVEETEDDDDDDNE